MTLINPDREFCYRITHIDNLSLIIRDGICAKNHENASEDFVPIGNPEIINFRDQTPVRIQGYGYLSEYVPFYFTPRSIMLLNIITGYKEPQVPKLPKEKILVIRCEIAKLAEQCQCFFTDGQANDNATAHYQDLKDLDQIDWESIQNSNFKKTDEDFDRQRRYQAEFLVYQHVPLNLVKSLHVFNERAKDLVQQELDEVGIDAIPVHISKNYYF